jgi:hypothetical protein
LDVNQRPVQIGQVFGAQRVRALAADQFHLSAICGYVQDEIQVVLMQGALESCT